jgi:dCTP diphosphatase
MASPTLTDLTEAVVRFRDERDWKQFHNPKDMAISLVLEASELLELTQWKNGSVLDDYLSEKCQDVGAELSDILYWILLIANDLNIDIAEAFREKMTVNETKYPVRDARGSSKKYGNFHSK